MDKTDIVITVSGGVVNGVFGPEGTSVLLLDFDNIKDGDTWGAGEVDDAVDSKACQNAIKEAEGITAKHRKAFDEAEEIIKRSKNVQETS